LEKLFSQQKHIYLNRLKHLSIVYKSLQYAYQNFNVPLNVKHYLLLES